MIEITLVSLKTFVDLLKSSRELLPSLRAKDSVTFEQIIKPLFEEVQNVLDEYLALMRLSLDALGQTARTPEGDATALSALREHRHRLLSTRIAVREEVGIMAENAHYRQLKSFLDAIAGIFGAVNPIMPPVPISPGADALKLLDAVMVGAIDRDDAIDAVKRSLKHLEEGFEAVAKAYAHLKIDYSIRRIGRLRG